MTTLIAPGNLSPQASAPESTAAWLRLAVALALGTIGGVGMWSVPVALPAVQAEFAVARGDAALPYTLTMIGFAVGGVLMGRLADRFSIVAPLIVGALMMGAGYVYAGFATSLWQFTLAQGLLVGIGTSVSFAPLMADISQWFVRRRGIAVTICASGSYLAGTIWPPTLQHFIATSGWRATHIGLGLFCAAVMLPLALLMRRKVSVAAAAAAGSKGSAPETSIRLSPNALQILLCVAGLSCCVAMAMPQVHIVAYCGDLGYGVARGAEMLSLMLGFGIVSRVGSGFVADRIGGVRTLLLGSVLQSFALFLYLLFDGLTSLYAISVLFGLFQGGLVPCYAIIVREYFPANEAGTRVGIIIMATLFGMALGGWMSGVIFDLTGSYSAAFLNGIAWNALNIAVMVWILARSGRFERPARA